MGSRPAALQATKTFTPGAPKSLVYHVRVSIALHCFFCAALWTKSMTSYRDTTEKMRQLHTSHPSGDVGTVIDAIRNQDERIGRMENEISKLRSEIQQLKTQSAKRY